MTSSRVKRYLSHRLKAFNEFPRSTEILKRFDQSLLARYEVRLVQEVCSRIVISSHMSFYAHRRTIRRRISLVFTLWPLWCHLMRSLRFKMADKTRKRFLLKLFTDEILKLLEKNNQIRQQRSMWRQFNRNKKSNYAIVESMNHNPLQTL